MVILPIDMLAQFLHVASTSAPGHRMEIGIMSVRMFARNVNGPTGCEGVAPLLCT
jgi:hypothetical protein